MNTPVKTLGIYIAEKKIIIADIEQLACSPVVPGAAAGHSRSQIVEVPCGSSIWHFLLGRRVSRLI